MKKIILYDSDCGFCDKFRFLISKISPNIFDFISLKSKGGTKFLASLGLLKTYRDKIIFIQGSKSFCKFAESEGQYQTKIDNL